MTRLYAADDERRIGLQARVRRWARAGLIDPTRARVLEDDLRVDLRRTGRVLRGGLALFTLIVVAAGVGLLLVGLDIRGDAAIATTLAVAAVGCYAGAEFLAGSARLYRHGVEEVLAVGSVLLASISTGLFVEVAIGPVRDRTSLTVALAVGTLGSLHLFRRFGFVYAGVAALGCAGLIPFVLVTSESLARGLAAAVLVRILAFVRHQRSDSTDERVSADFVIFEASATAAIYLVANLVVTHELLGTASLDGVSAAFKWLTWVATWTLPVLALTEAIRRRERVLADTALAMLLTTVITNKPYLGLARRPWDPIVFGGLLIGAVVVVRRWLNAGADQQRAGYTSNRILPSDRDLVGWVSVASVAVQPTHDVPSDSGAEHFGGGRSGGAGAGADF